MVIQLDGLTSSQPLSMDAVQEGVRVSYEGRAVALLEGLTAADIPDIRVGISNLDGLDDAINGDGAPPPTGPVVFAPPPAASLFDTAPPAPATQPTSADVTIEEDRDPVRLSGTSGNDTISATDVATSLRGNAGNDLLFGGDTDENIDGGAGMDTIVAGSGNDTFSGGRGDDLIYLGDGNDSSAGFGGQDPGNDTVYGGAGDDFLRDDAGRNLTFGGEGSDRISSVNSFSGAELNGADTLIGGAGNDTLSGDAGDLIYGGIGEDQFGVYDNGSAATIIADFNISDDTLEIVLPTEPSESIDFSHDPAQNGVSIAVDGEIIAFLHGVTADQVGALRTGTSVLVDGTLAVSA
jgi:Ca2+-binding RTX toxin-like protein